MIWPISVVLNRVEPTNISQVQLDAIMSRIVATMEYDDDVVAMWVSDKDGSLALAHMNTSYKLSAGSHERSMVEALRGNEPGLSLYRTDIGEGVNVIGTLGILKQTPPPQPHHDELARELALHNCVCSAHYYPFGVYRGLYLCDP